jgi:hypothetical protein
MQQILFLSCYLPSCSGNSLPFKEYQKGKLSLCLITHYAMMIWGSGGIAPPFLTQAVDGGELTASRPGRFTSPEIALGTHRKGGWVGCRVSLAAVEMRKVFLLLGTEEYQRKSI